MLRADLHIHTIASGHAYSTILESVTHASSIGVEVVAITDHGPSMEGAPHEGYFANMARIPREMQGVNLFMGCEANVVDFSGNIDLSEGVIKGLDVVLVGLHKYTPYPRGSSMADNTKALIGAITNNLVHIVSHPYRLDFPVDITELARAACGHGVLLELNLSLLKLFGKNEKLINQINLMIEAVDKLGTKIVISSDAHIATEIGDDSVLSDLCIQLPKKLVLGSQNGYDEIREFLAARG
ncbi:MAG: PHP domain-containing protein [Patescibacteria group bacterium]